LIHVQPKGFCISHHYGWFHVERVSNASEQQLFRHKEICGELVGFALRGILFTQSRAADGTFSEHPSRVEHDVGEFMSSSESRRLKTELLRYGNLFATGVHLAGKSMVFIWGPTKNFWNEFEFIAEQFDRYARVEQINWVGRNFTPPNLVALSPDFLPQLVGCLFG